MAEGGPVFEELLLMVSDLRASKDFYLTKLGFRAEYEGDDFVILRTGGTRILLHDAGGEPVPAADLELEIRVDDVDRLYEELASQGVALRKAPFVVSHEGDPWSPRREARLRDPDGYGITLFTPVNQ
ncbi:MAG: VOC family protein [Euryarchaeota archaeon]|nr:VOC family protein [Euryarchaeota archaeon]